MNKLKNNENALQPIIMTNFASPQTKQQKNKITNHKIKQALLPHIHIPNINNTKSAPKTNITTNAPLHTTNLQLRSSSFKWERCTKHDDSAMQPASPMRFTAMCEGWGAHKRSWKRPPATQQKTIKSTTIFNMCVNARNHHACTRWCAPHHHDKLRIAQTKQ